MEFTIVHNRRKLHLWNIDNGILCNAYTLFTDHSSVIIIESDKVYKKYIFDYIEDITNSDFVCLKCLKKANKLNKPNL